jgi:hypothetical protein
MFQILFQLEMSRMHEKKIALVFITSRVVTGVNERKGWHALRIFMFEFNQSLKLKFTCYSKIISASNDTLLLIKNKFAIQSFPWEIRK